MLKSSDKFSLMATEILTVATVIVLALITVYPLLEEWGLLLAYEVHGVKYLSPDTHGIDIPLRPLHLIPYFLAWLLGNGSPIGVTIAVTILAVSRYFVCRWAVTPVMGGYQRWIAATLAAVLIPWSGAWLGRYMSAQFTALLFCAAIGFSFRLLKSRSLKMSLGLVASVSAILFTYQALFVLIAALPLFVSYAYNENCKSYTRSCVLVNTPQVFFPVALGVLIYAGYALTRFGGMGGGYEEGLANGVTRILTMPGLISHLEKLYSTAFFDGLTLPLIILIVAYILFGGYENNEKNTKFQWNDLVVIACTFLLPIASIVYVSALHANDPDRVLFPVSVGFLMVAICALKKARVTFNVMPGQFALRGVVLVGVIVLSAIATTIPIREFSLIQKNLISQLLALKLNNYIATIYIRDETGLLGDVYTFYANTLSDALALKGRPVRAVICTPMANDRLHVYARRFPIPSTDECEKIDFPSENSLVLTASISKEEIVLYP